MPWFLFLDDERFPPENNTQRPEKDWVIARTYEDAVALVEEKGLPNFISFDHDLGIDDDLVKRKTGKDFANWLVNWCMDHDWPYIFYTVHSMNPEGAKNINLLLLNYLEQDEVAGKQKRS